MAAVKDDPFLPLFHQPWWLDAVSGDAGWSAFVARASGEFVALPVHCRRKYGIAIFEQPPLSRNLGPIYSQGVYSSKKQRSIEKKLCFEVLQMFPKKYIYRQAWDVRVQNWLPFYWRGFNQTTFYTNTVSLGSEGQAKLAVDPKVRNDIKKARQAGLRTLEKKCILNLKALIRTSYTRKNVPPPYAETFLDRVFEAASEHRAVRVFEACDANGTAHAAAMIVYDRKTAYYLLGGVDTQKGSRGSMSMLLLDTINEFAKSHETFDFEGSMNEGIESFFRSFGAKQTPYFYVTGYQPGYLRLLDSK